MTANDFFNFYSKKIVPICTLCAIITLVFFIKKGEAPLRQGAHRRPGGVEEQGRGLDGFRQDKDGQSPHAVDGADREQEVALPVLLGTVGEPGKGHLQKKTKKAVKEKLPEQSGQALTSSLLQFYRGDGKHTKEFLSKRGWSWKKGD